MSKSLLSTATRRGWSILTRLSHAIESNRPRKNQRTTQLAPLAIIVQPSFLPSLILSTDAPTGLPCPNQGGVATRGPFTDGKRRSVGGFRVPRIRRGWQTDSPNRGRRNETRNVVQDCRASGQGRSRTEWQRREDDSPRVPAPLAGERYPIEGPPHDVRPVQDSGGKARHSGPRRREVGAAHFSMLNSSTPS